jgi:flagellar biosynthetic protein FlhB
MEQTGEKTEQPTTRRLEEAVRNGQFPRSAEVQTVAVILATVFALGISGHEIWRHLVRGFNGILGHLHDIPIGFDTLQSQSITAAMVAVQCTWPVLAAALVAGLIAGGAQSRFQTASDVLKIDWNRLNPVTGIKRLFSFRSAVPTVIAMVKLATILALTYSQVQTLLGDPIFYTTVDAAQVGRFLVQTSTAIILRVCLAMIVIAAIDYAYQFWRTTQELMMTKQEVKDDSKNSEGNPQVKARQRKRARNSQRRMYAEVPKADVIVTNPTHLAIALRYDRKSMKAPRIVAKGSRLNALRIREIARQHRVPIIENKPLARLMFKYGRVGSEIPTQVYAAVAEVLAWVYRINRYRYYVEQNQVSQ